MKRNGNIESSNNARECRLEDKESESNDTNRNGNIESSNDTREGRLEDKGSESSDMNRTGNIESMNNACEGRLEDKESESNGMNINGNIGAVVHPPGEIIHPRPSNFQMRRRILNMTGRRILNRDPVEQEDSEPDPWASEESSDEDEGSLEENEQPLRGRLCPSLRLYGYCRYESCCRFSHPKDFAPVLDFTVNSVGLPLRPGAEVCPTYQIVGLCKFGISCKYDHPPLRNRSTSPFLAPIKESPASSLAPTDDYSASSSAASASTSDGTTSAPLTASIRNSSTYEGEEIG